MPLPVLKRNTQRHMCARHTQTHTHTNTDTQSKALDIHSEYQLLILLFYERITTRTILNDTLQVHSLPFGI